MKPQRALVLAVVVVASLAATPLAAAGAGVSPADASVQPDAAAVADVTHVDEDDDPSTAETIGYVEGISYDDDLPVDDRAGATVDEDELEAVVHRSMARVEVLREQPFEDDVDVEVVTREEFAEEDGAFVGELTAEDELFENVRLEGLFLADRETDALDEYETLYGGAVAGYYDPETDEIVIVSDDLEAPELDELTLGHELIHALQDQRFDLERYDRDTQNRNDATLGLIEGEAVRVETRYERRCGADWECVLPGTPPDVPTDVNWGLYFTLIQPYDDGPDYVDHRLAEGDWDAVDAAFDAPPASSSEVIRPGEEREPVSIDLEDTSSDGWDRVERPDAPDHDTLGEAAIAAAFMAQTYEAGETVVVEEDALFDGTAGTSLNFDHPVTDGWAGDEFVVYAAAGGESPDDAAFVWRSEWLDADDAAAFEAGYRAVLEHHDAERIGEDAYAIEDGFPGAYHVDRDGETVTIVRAPSADDLPAVHEDATVTAVEADADDAGDDGGTDDDDAGADDAGDDGGTDDDGEAAGDDAAGTDEPVPGFGVVASLCALLVALLAFGSRR